MIENVLERLLNDDSLSMEQHEDLLFIKDFIIEMMGARKQAEREGLSAKNASLMQYVEFVASRNLQCSDTIH